MRTCDTCTHRSSAWVSWWHTRPECNRPNASRDPVTGKLIAVACWIERKPWRHTDCCGPDGKYHSDVFPIKEVK